MPTLSDIIKDPNYINANPATKRAIFEKWAPQDRNYTGANGATQTAIRQRFGVDSGGGNANPEPPPVPATAQPKERSWGDIAKMGLHAITQGGLDIAGGIVDTNPMNMVKRATDNLTNYVFDNVLPKPKHHATPHVTVAPTGADMGEAVAEVARRKMGGPSRDTYSPTEKLVTEGVRGATGALLVPGAGAERVGAKLIPRLATEALSGAGSSAAAEAARQANLGPVGEIAAAMAGGTLGGAPRFIKEGAGKAGEYLNIGEGGRAEGRGLARAGRQLQKAVTDKDAAILNIEGRPESAVPGVTPLTAEVAKDPGLAAAARSTFSTPAQTQQYENAQAGIKALGDVTEGGDAGAVKALSDRQARRHQKALDDAHANIGPVVEGDVVGRTFREHFEDAYDTMKKHVSALYNHPIMSHEFSVPKEIAGNVYNKVRSVADDFYGNAGGDAPRKVQSAVYDILDELSGNSVSTKTLTNVDTRLADFAGEASMSGRTKEAAFANSVRDAIHSQTKDIGPPNYRRQVAKARAARAEQGVRFEQGRVAEAMAEKRYGQAAVPDTEVAKKLVPSGDAGATTANEMVSALGPNSTLPEETVRAQLKRMIDNNQLVPDTLKKQFGQIARKFPALKDHVDALVQKSSAIKKFMDSPFGKLSQDKDPTVAIHKMMTSPDTTQFDGLVRTIRTSGDPDAMKGLRRILSDYVDKASTQGADYDQHGKLIPNTDTGAHALDMVLGHNDRLNILEPEQAQAIKAIRDQMAASNFASHGGVHRLEGDAIQNIPLAAGPTARTLKFAWEWAGNNRHVNAMIDKALIDPDFAAQLLKRATGERKARVMRAIRLHAKGAALAAGRAANTTETQNASGQTVPTYGQ